MSNYKQTALQILKERLLRDKEIYTKEIFYEIHLYIDGILSDIDNELLAMEKEEIENAYKQGQYDSEPIRETDLNNTTTKHTEVTMSNNKQSIKLYTTDQVIDIFEKYGNMSAINARNIIDLSESIELPSDEEIKDGYEPKTMYDLGCLDGAKWMRDKIQGGNK